MSFIDQKPHIATEAQCAARWSAGKPGEKFRCYLCGHKFVVGDIWRWVFGNTNGQALGNFLVCQKCDGDDVLERYKAAIAEAKQRFWWLYAEIESWKDEVHYVQAELSRF